MTLLKVKNRLFYFAHIPKTGGSSLETAMREAGAKRALHYHKHMNYVSCNLQHMHAKLYDTFVPPDFYSAGFCVVRHPIARLVSEYRWRQTLDQAKVPFDKWVYQKLKAYQKDPYILDNHLRPQHEFIGEKIEVFRFEDGMENIMARISEMTGLTLNTQTHVRKPTINGSLTWSPESRALALRFYEEDFETLSYDYDMPVTNLTIER
ncbi:MAG: hypothetical protein ACI8TF_002866 [Paracoccaceae bacterium]|jgi:hypothetical protein